jgi:predicted transglutaminase-like cysteine proteinase
LGIFNINSRVYSIRRVRLAVACALAPLLLAAPLSAADQMAAAPAARASSGAPVETPSQARAAGRLYTGFWNAMLSRNWGGQDSCVGELGRGCNLNSWHALIEGLRGESPARQLDRVNRFVNRVRYRTDESNWSRRDYWAAPREFFARGGDCEDFAIAKYLSLRALGFRAEDMRLLILWDHKRNAAHAVLALHYGGRELVLDNLRRRIVPLARLPHYQVHYSVDDGSVLWHMARN